jgi:hypothetical protein
MNRSIRTVAAVLGLVFALGGMSHGFFETLQGSTPTDGVIIEAIGEDQRMWEHGNETAFTLIPNFLLTGLAAITVSIAIAVWSLRYLDSQHGATVYLLLFILLFLVGGGIGQVLFFVPGWAFATRINHPLAWWRKTLPDSVRRGLAPLWRYTTALGAGLVLVALWIAVTGAFPGFSDDDQLLPFMGMVLLGGFMAFVVSFVAAIAHDIAAG